MEGKEIEAKQFKCKKHPKESIQRITINTDGQCPLFCLECVINRQQGAQPLPKLHSIEEYFEEIRYRMNDFELFIRKENVAPKETKAFLAKEEELIKTLSSHIDKEKEKIKHFFGYMWTEISDLLMKKKEALVKKLDRDLIIFKENMQTLKAHIDLTYKKDAPNSLPIKDHLVQKLSTLKSSEELEKYIVKLNNDTTALLAKRELPEDFFRSLAKKKINKCTQEFQSAVTEHPPTFEVQPLNQFLEDFHKMIRDLSTKNDLEPVSFFSRMQTTIDIPEEQKKLIEDWIDENANIGFSLRYRATRDGFSGQDFHERCNGLAPTLTIVKAANGAVFGGYTDIYWDPTDMTKTEEIDDDKFKKTFLFSLKNGEKYDRISKGLVCTVRDPKQGPTFGTQDLSIGYNGDLKDGISELGTVFRKGSDGKSIFLAEEKQFKAQEIEVLVVKAYKKVGSKANAEPKACDSPLKKLLVKEMRNKNEENSKEKNGVFQGQLGMFKDQISKDLAQAVNNLSKLEKQNNPQAHQAIHSKFAEKLGGVAKKQPK